MPKIRIKRGALTNLPILDKGELAITTDTKKLYVGTDSGNYIPADMQQSVYDTNADGKVNSADLADSVPWSGVTDTPTTLAGYGIIDGGGSGNTNAVTLATRHIYELDQYNMVRSAKDINGLFTQVDYNRYDGTLFIRSILSGGASPSYTTRTMKFYDIDGLTVVSTVVYALSYDGDGEITSETKV